MSLRRFLLCSLLGAAALGAHPAAARTPAARSGGDRTGVEAGLGADFMVDDNAGGFLGTLALDTPIARNLTLGGRSGFFLESDPSRFGIPIDARLRLRIRQVYVDGLAGPWIQFRSDHRLRFHAGVGAGLVLRGGVRLGAELGYLDPSSMLGLRIAFAF